MRLQFADMVNQKRHIGDSIRTLRVLSGFNQAELAEQIGKTRGMVSHIENTGKVNYYTLQAIAKALKTTVEFIENYHLGPLPTEYNPTSKEPPHTYGQKDIHALEAENALLKEMIEYQRKVISLLESRLDMSGSK